MFSCSSICVAWDAGAVSICRGAAARRRSFRRESSTSTASGTTSSRRSGRRDVRTDAEFGAIPGANANDPAQTRKHHALVEPADQRHPLGDHRHPAVLRKELLLELPAELADVRVDVDAAIFEFLDHAIGEKREAEAGSGEVC